MFHLLKKGGAVQSAASPFLFLCPSYQVPIAMKAKLYVDFIKYVSLVTHNFIKTVILQHF